MEIKGKSVFLTGGASGIGKAIVEALATKGAKVFFCDKQKEAGVALETELRIRLGTQDITFAECNVANAAQFEEVFRRAVSTFGRIDVMVNNAGILDEHDWEKMMAVNLAAYIRGSKMALQHMRRDKGGYGGVIIQVASIGSLIAVHQHPVYVACKAAIVNYTQSWATNPHAEAIGVRWGCLCPGATTTAIQDSVVANTEWTTEEPEAYLQTAKNASVSAEFMAEGFLDLLRNEDSNGALYVVIKKGAYRKRALVDMDGASNKWLADDAASIAACLEK